LWKTDALVTDAASAKAVVAGAAPTVTLQVNGRYRQDLEVGNFLVCRRPSCVGVEVVAGHVTTVHVNLPFGIPHLIVFDGATKARLETTDLDVGL
jgi:hypothetical protein